jgi:hypothetical protein
MRRLLPVLLLLFFVEPILAQPARGPLAPGKTLPGPFHPYNATGASKGRYHCLISEYGEDPVVLIFARGLYDNEAFRDLLSRIEAAITRNPTARLRCCVVFLPRELPNPVTDDDKRDELAPGLEKLAEEAKLKQVVLCLGSKPELAKYELDDSADLTVVLYRKFQILSSFAVPADKIDAGLVKSIMAELGPKLGATR